MTPFLEGKSDIKKTHRFYFAIKRSKVTKKQMMEELEQFGFKQDYNPPKSEQFDFSMRIRLEEHYNPSKFAKDLIAKYKDKIMEIKLGEL